MKTAQHMQPRLYIATTLYTFFIVLIFSTNIPAADLIHNVQVDKSDLDLATPDNVTITWVLTEPVTTSVFICDLKGNLVRNLMNKDQLESGNHSITWNGMDQYDTNVANGVYYPIVKAKSIRNGSDTYNPTSQTWGHDVIPQDLKYKEQIISFAIQRATYARLRVGLKEGGPVYKTLAPWQLWTPGEHQVVWNGKDHEDFNDVTEKEKLTYSFDAFEIPENSMVVRNAPDFDRGSVVYENFPTHPPATSKTSYYALAPTSHELEPEITAEFTNSTSSDGRAILQGRTECSVSFLSPEKGSAVISKGSELLLYLDDEFIVEYPISGIPTIVAFDTTKHSNGNHYLTFNLLTPDDRAGVAIKKILIKN